MSLQLHKRPIHRVVKEERRDTKEEVDDDEDDEVQSPRQSKHPRQETTLTTRPRQVVAQDEYQEEDEVRAHSFVKQGDEYVHELTGKRLITVKPWKNTILVDIREFYDSQGEKKPGKKGISLSLDQWKKVMAMELAIDEAIDELQSERAPRAPHDDGEELERLQDVEDGSIAYAISAKRRVTLKKWKNTMLVDFREFYDANGAMRPGKKGISLSLDQWNKLKAQFGGIEAVIDEIETTC